MQCHDPCGDRQAEADAAGLAVPRIRDAIEGLNSSTQARQASRQAFKTMIVSIASSLRNVRIGRPRAAEPPDGGRDSFASARNLVAKRNVLLSTLALHVLGDVCARASSASDRWGAIRQMVGMLDELKCPVM
jgi:hypothetical protein